MRFPLFTSLPMFLAVAASAADLRIRSAASMGSIHHRVVRGESPDLVAELVASQGSGSVGLKANGMEPD